MHRLLCLLSSYADILVFYLPEDVDDESFTDLSKHLQRSPVSQHAILIDHFESIRQFEDLQVIITDKCKLITVMYI